MSPTSNAQVHVMVCLCVMASGRKLRPGGLSCTPGVLDMFQDPRAAHGPSRPLTSLVYFIPERTRAQGEVNSQNETQVLCVCVIIPQTTRWGCHPIFRSLAWPLLPGREAANGGDRRFLLRPPPSPPDVHTGGWTLSLHLNLGFQGQESHRASHAPCTTPAFPVSRLERLIPAALGYRPPPPSVIAGVSLGKRSFSPGLPLPRAGGSFAKCIVTVDWIVGSFLQTGWLLLEGQHLKCLRLCNT